MRTKIEYLHPNIAHFPELDEYINHGFSWGKGAGNFAYSFGDKVEVFQRNKGFFETMQFGLPKEAILLLPQHRDSIVMIDEEIIVQRGSKVGISVKGDAAFTYLENVTIIVKVADCQTYFVYGKRADGKEIKGIVHSGWRGTNLLFSQKVIDHLVNNEGILPQTIKIGLVPGIFQKDRTLQHLDDIEGDISHWNKFQYFKDGIYYLDSRGFTISQLINSGVLPDNICKYDINTFDAAKKGECYSQKYEYLEKSAGRDIEEGRFIVGLRS